jgi:ribosomal protein L11 methyltransferase
VITVPEGRRAESEAVLLEISPEGFEETAAGFAVVRPAEAADPVLPPWMSIRSEPVAPGWRDGWRAFHGPCRIAGTWIRPPWLDEPTDAVVLEPGYAFGTGTHPTTRGVGEMLAAEPPGSLLDLGCGSGLLSVLAARWGHRPVEAWDLDPHAVAAARANLARNGLAEAVRVFEADVLAAPLPACDLALANIERRTVEALLRREGLPERVIVGGLRDDDALDLTGWTIDDERVEDGWRTLRLRRLSSPR